MWIIRTYIGTFRKFDDFGGRANRAEFRNFSIVPFVIQLCFPVIGALSPVGYLFENGTMLKFRNSALFARPPKSSNFLKVPI